MSALTENVGLRKKVDFMTKVVSSLTSALSNCILPLLRSSGDTRPMSLWRIQLGRADIRDDTTLAMA